MFESCIIRLVEKTDLPMLLQWRNHPDIRKFMFTQENIEVDLSDESNFKAFLN